MAFPCYWYKLDRNDRDWSLHISYLIETIKQRHPDFGRRARAMLEQLGGPGSSRPGVAAYLLAEMNERLTSPAPSSSMTGSSCRPSQRSADSGTRSCAMPRRRVVSSSYRAPSHNCSSLASRRMPATRSCGPMRSDSRMWRSTNCSGTSTTIPSIRLELAGARAADRGMGGEPPARRGITP